MQKIWEMIGALSDAPAGPLLVTSALDDGRPGTFRRAVDQANTLGGENTITFDPIQSHAGR